VCATMASYFYAVMREQTIPLCDVPAGSDGSNMEEPVEPAFSHVVKAVTMKKKAGVVRAHPHILDMVQVGPRSRVCCVRARVA
jgi:hypothetical protein